jgi:AcrR family transcriptional regulator
MTRSTSRQPTHRTEPAASRPRVANKPETKGERTRAALIEASYNLFLSRGYHGTSMRNIADEAGLALGGIYNHFATKEEIFVAMLMERHPFLDVVPALQAAQGDSVEELVCDAASRMIAALDDRPDFLNLIYIELVEFEGSTCRSCFKLSSRRSWSLCSALNRWMACCGPCRCRSFCARSSAFSSRMS